MGLTETEKRLKIVEDISDRVSSDCQGVLLGGSVAFGNATENSDIDVMFLVEPVQARSFNRSLGFKDQISGKALDVMNNFGFLGIWAKEVIEGIEVNCFLYHAKSLEEYLTLKEPFDLWRKTKPREETPVDTFDGTRLTLQRKVSPLWEGYGYSMPTFADNRFYSSAIRGQFLGAGVIMKDRDGILADLEKKAWRAAISQLVKEHNPVDLSKHNVLNTLYAFHSGKLPKDWAERVQERTQKELADYLAKE